MTTHISGHESGVLLLHIKCELCAELSLGFPNDEAAELHAHPTRFHAMADGWLELLRNGEFFYVCPKCVKTEKEGSKTMATNGTFKQEIEIKLTPDQIAERKDRLVFVETEIDRVKSEKRHAVLVHNEELKDHYKERAGLLTACNSGIEKTEVECYQRLEERRGEMLTIRCDTQEILTALTRPLTADERQLTLDDAKPTGKGKGKGRGRKANDAETGAEA